jgi:predicted O-methyltransferase YrrM
MQRPDRIAWRGSPCCGGEGDGGVTHLHPERTILRASPLALDVATLVAPFTVEATGNISGEDGAFLLTMIERQRPRHVLEIGIASGTSSLMMLAFLDRLGEDTRLTSVDAVDRYYGNPARKVGYLVPEWYGSVPDRWTVLTGCGAAGLDDHPALRDQALARRFDLAFIDANHAHPWPTLDVLCILPFLQPGSWVVLHDINLPLLGDYPQFGPAHLLRGWAGQAMIDEDPGVPNTGALKLWVSDATSVADLLPILSLPWQVALAQDELASILSHVASHFPPDVSGPACDAIREGNARMQVAPIG